MKNLIASFVLLLTAGFSTATSASTATCDRLVIDNHEYVEVKFTFAGLGTDSATMSASSTEVTQEYEASLMHAEARTRTVEEGGVVREETYYVWVPVTETRTRLVSVSAANELVDYNKSDANELMSSKVTSSSGGEHLVFFDHQLHSNVIKVYTFGSGGNVYNKTCAYSEN